MVILNPAKLFPINQDSIVVTYRQNLSRSWYKLTNLTDPSQDSFPEMYLVFLLTTSSAESP